MISHNNENWIHLIHILLTAPVLPEDLNIDPVLQQKESFKKLYNCIMDIRSLTSSLSKGDLQNNISGKGFTLSNLKALQSNLKHLTWQTNKVAEGDFSQRVDFLGDFSDAFNEMITKLHNSSIRLTQLAHVDTLTKVPNRRALEKFLKKSFKDSVEKKKPYSIIIFDIDFFKSVNGTYGHYSGDIVLVKVSDLLSKQFRTNDIFSRYGGEEFMAALPGTGAVAAEKIAQRALKTVEATPIYLPEADTEVSVTVSAGISERRKTDENFTDIIKKSDKALYEAKRSGRNRVCID